MTEHQRQAGEVLRLAKIFLEGCGNTVGKGPEECPGCAEDFVARVRKAVAEPPSTDLESKDAGTLMEAYAAWNTPEVAGNIREESEIKAALAQAFRDARTFDVAGYARAAGQAENPILLELPFIPEDEAQTVSRTPLPEMKWTGADDAEMGPLGDEP